MHIPGRITIAADAIIVTHAIRQASAGSRHLQALCVSKRLQLFCDEDQSRWRDHEFPFHISVLPSSQNVQKLAHNIRKA